jgi:hypothetical protein
MHKIDVEAVKRASEATVREHDGRICDWLPSPEPDTQPRDVLAVARRALILNALIQISFKGPIPIIKSWIENNGLASDLAESERLILTKSNAALTQQELANLFWRIEALWALVWVGGLIKDLPLNKPVGDNLASLCPNLQRNADGTDFIKSFQLRRHEELFCMLDLYYRAHWWTRNAQLTGQQTGDVSLDIIMERRKTLEWVLDAKADWDNVEMST